MSAEHKNDLETNALAEKLTTGWDQFKQGKLISYKVMAVILLVATAVGLSLYIWSEKKRTGALAWLDLDSANTISLLEEVASKHPDSPAAKVALFDVAKQQLGPDGIDKLVTGKPEERTKAVENVEKARESMTRMVDEFKNDPVLRAECYLGLAKAEAALVGIAKSGGTSSEFRGSIDKVVEWLDKLAEAASGTPWGDDAKKTAEALRTNPKVKEEFRDFQVNIYNIAQMPPVPGAGPISPSGGPPLGGLSGIPGGGGNPLTPVAPPAIPPVPPAPIQPGATTPTPPAGGPVAPPATPPAATPPAPKPPTPTAPTKK